MADTSAGICLGSAENGFKVLNTFYDHADIHKYTWKCPGRGLKSIIDYFLVRNEMKRNVNNVKVVRGAEIGSDHHLVLMKVRLYGRVYARKVEEHSRLSTERLATKEGKMVYQIRLRLKLNGAKWVNGSDVEKSWEEFRSEVMETAEVCVGERSSGLAFDLQ